MYGVVLWRGADGKQAVIWCDDHGDLALYRSVDAELKLEVGDLVSFRTEQSRRMRVAKDVVLVEQDRFPNLPDHLKAADADRSMPMPGDKVIPFDSARGKHPAPAVQTGVRATV